VVVEGDTSPGIKDGRAGVSDKVAGDNLVLDVAENALELALGGLLHGGLDLLVGGGLLEASSEVNDGDVDGGHAEGHSSELAVEGRDDLSDSLGSSSGGGDDVHRGGTAGAPVLASLGGAIHGQLVSGGGVDSGHETLDDSELVVENLGDGSQAGGIFLGAEVSSLSLLNNNSLAYQLVVHDALETTWWFLGS